MISPLRVCIDARHVASNAGGTATFTLSLARALSELTDGDEQYFFLVRPGDGPKLEQQVGKPLQTIESNPIAPPSLARRVTTRIPLARKLWHRLGGRAGAKIAQSDGTVERNNVDVIHFTAQGGFLTDIPFIYHPHDLQHKHLPDFFTNRERSVRDLVNSIMCERAAIVSVVSQWIKQDLVDTLNLAASKIRVLHFAPDPHNCLNVDPNVLGAIAQKFSLPKKFIFYPARTWPHKNHLRLIQALKILRDHRGLTIPLVCSGEWTEFYQTLKTETRTLGLNKQVYFTGFVDLDELSALYQLSSAVVIPTLFEAGSFPLWEAFLSGRPAACSNVTSLPAQAGDAALIFDPYKVEEIADAVKRLWTDSDLCAALVARGRTNVSRYSWEDTARGFRALYRQLGNRQLTAEDERLLSAPPLM
jgi:glycosyltransferase involved in cell wall biosynthesis